MRSHSARQDGCATGDAKITRGYDLPARFVIYTVGPVWKGGGHREQLLLASCYRRSLELAIKHGLESIAFPGISTGVNGYPVRYAAETAVDTVRTLVSRPGPLEQVIFCCFSPYDLEVYEALLGKKRGA